jgi:tRNA(Ile)-lysidine synthase
VERPDAAGFRLERRLGEFVLAQVVLRSSERTLLMLSGGADSMALLYLLEAVELRLGFGLRHAALHVDYGARGADSDRDRAIVERACGGLGVPLHVVRLRRQLEGAGFQEQARALRYRHARELARAHGYDVIVTAHNRDDQAETILYRLTKYASPRGLMGMRPREQRLARPLLCLGAAEIRGYCAVRDIAYGEDVTNQQTRYARNMIRLEVLPSLRRLNPRVGETLAAAAELAAAEATVLAAATAAAQERVACAPQAEDLAALGVADLLREEPALRSLVLHEWVRTAMGADALVERRVVEALLSLVARVDDGGRVTLSRGLEVVRGGGRLRLRRRPPAHACDQVAVEGARLAEARDGALPVAFCGRRFRVALEPGPVLPTCTTQALIGLAERPGLLTLRHPRRGERFAPLGLGAETTLARFLAGARVPADLRGRALVLDVDGRAAWVGFAAPGGASRARVAHDFRVHESSRWTLHMDEEEA